jgi:AmmeMemoRadiSam system protein B
MAHVRPAAVAGIFYPGTRSALAAEVREHLAGASLQCGDAIPAPKAIIVPHAGFVYSGAIAASAYARLAAGREAIRRVVLFGPTHRVPVRALAVPSVEAFATPMGEIPIDRKAVTQALALPHVTTSDASHAYEHSLEVQLPFLQAVLGDFSLVPFAVGSATPNEVSEVIELLWGGAETLIVVSSDLSHYRRYAEAQRTDRATGEAILAFSATLDHEQACGATPINGLLVAARRRGLVAELLDLRNSGDTAGDRNRVVGYASFAFVEPPRVAHHDGERR